MYKNNSPGDSVRDPPTDNSQRDMPTNNSQRDTPPDTFSSAIKTTTDGNIKTLAENIRTLNAKLSQEDNPKMTAAQYRARVKNALAIEFKIRKFQQEVETLENLMKLSRISMEMLSQKRDDARTAYQQEVGREPPDVILLSKYGNQFISLTNKTQRLNDQIRIIHEILAQAQNGLATGRASLARSKWSKGIPAFSLKPLNDATSSAIELKAEVETKLGNKQLESIKNKVNAILTHQVDPIQPVMPSPQPVNTIIPHQPPTPSPSNKLGQSLHLGEYHCQRARVLIQGNDISTLTHVFTVTTDELQLDNIPRFDLLHLFIYVSSQERLSGIVDDRYKSDKPYIEVNLTNTECILKNCKIVDGTSRPASPKIRIPIDDAAIRDVAQFLFNTTNLPAALMSACLRVALSEDIDITSDFTPRRVVTAFKELQLLAGVTSDLVYAYRQQMEDVLQQPCKTKVNVQPSDEYRYVHSGREGLCGDPNQMQWREVTPPPAFSPISNAPNTPSVDEQPHKRMRAENPVNFSNLSSPASMWSLEDTMDESDSPGGSHT